MLLLSLLLYAICKRVNFVVGVLNQEEEEGMVVTVSEYTEGGQI